MVEPDRPQMTIWRMHFACGIARSTHIQYATPTAFPLQRSFYERASMLCSTYITCLLVKLRNCSEDNSPGAFAL